MSSKSALQECLARVPVKSVQQECLAKSVQQRGKRQCPVKRVQQQCQECPARVSSKSVLGWVGVLCGVVLCCVVWLGVLRGLVVVCCVLGVVVAVAGGALECGVAECKCAGGSDREKERQCDNVCKIVLLHSASRVLSGVCMLKKVKLAVLLVQDAVGVRCLR